jgi:hypothetical protein
MEQQKPVTDDSAEAGVGLRYICEPADVDGSIDNTRMSYSRV